MLGYGKGENFVNDSWVWGLNDNVEWRVEKSRFGGWLSEIMPSKSLVTSGLSWGKREPLRWGTLSINPMSDSVRDYMKLELPLLPTRNTQIVADGGRRC